MTLSSLMAEADAELRSAFSELGEAVDANYFPKDGSAPYAVKVMPDKGELEQPYEHASKTDVVDVFTFWWSDINSAHLAGQNDMVNDEIVLDSVVWKILEVLSFDASMVMVRVKQQ